MMLQAHLPYYKLSEATLRKVVARPERLESSVGSNSTPHAPRVKKPLVLPSYRPTEQQLEGDIALAGWESVLVQPYRRRKSKPPPTGVPPLDLSKLNEPDSQMEPIRVVVAMTTNSSHHSWGPELEQMTSDLSVDINEESTLPMTSTTPELNNSQFEPSQAKFIEDKCLSNERGQSQPALGGVVPRHPATRQTAVIVPEASLNKKLRFEARVLTQNGRDVHRELCGFYFLSDGSLTVYEFRQFGRKSCALPLIQRSVYCHLFGSHCGKAYEINHIRKGATLHFLSSEHPGLPHTLASRPILALKITFVDESVKKQLLTEGCNPVEVRVLEHYLTENTETDTELHQTLRGMLVSRLTGHASQTLVGLGRALAAHGDRVSKYQLQQVLRTFHISLTVEDMAQLWLYVTSQQNDLKTSLIDGCHSNTSSGNSFHGNESVSVDGLISRLVGPLNEDRHSLVRKAFRKLDHLKTGSLDIDVLRRFFNPALLGGKCSSDDVWSSIISCLQLSTRGARLSYADFEHYYQGVSIEMTKDSDFIIFLRNCWSV